MWFICRGYGSNLNKGTKRRREGKEVVTSMLAFCRMDGLAWLGLEGLRMWWRWRWSLSDLQCKGISQVSSRHPATSLCFTPRPRERLRSPAPPAKCSAPPLIPAPLMSCSRRPGGRRVVSRRFYVPLSPTVYLLMVERDEILSRESISQDRQLEQVL